MKTYSITLDQTTGKSISITCHRCGKTSYHVEDVLHRYCAHCHIFHDDAALEFGSGDFTIEWWDYRGQQ